jgi:hypothetical protein
MLINVENRRDAEEAIRAAASWALDTETSHLADPRLVTDYLDEAVAALRSWRQTEEPEDCPEE